MQDIEILNIPSINSAIIKKNENAIDTIDAKIINYSDFFQNYMVKNEPCIIKNISLEWGCTKNWIFNDTINFHHFIENYGDLLAPVADCNEIVFNAQSKIQMTVRDYMNYLENQNNRKKLLYLKDWHLRKLKPHDLFYKVPLFFASDWLNEIALDCKEDDFMFVYIGPEDSWTPLHVDVYHSYSWSVNIVGRKKWILFPPGEEAKLKNRFGDLPLLFDPTKMAEISFYEIIQEKGDALFVPSGWHHQVLNMLDTISINHNWVNACNIEKVWTAMQNCLLAVENEISDLKDTSEYGSQCQLILKSLFGMDFISFIKFLCHIAKKRIAQLNGHSHLLFNLFNLGQNHIKFDLKSLHKVLNSISNHPLFIKKHLPPHIENDVISIMQSISDIEF